MSQLTEAEIFDCLRTNFRLAAEHCDLLAKLPGRGPTYDKFRAELKLIEGACRQAACWREDAGGVGAPLGFAGTHGLEAVRLGETDSAGWLEVAHMMGAVHQKAGDWLRGHYPRPLFAKLAEVLREMHRQMERRRQSRTGKAGLILPPLRPGPHRDTRPVQVALPASREAARITAGGLLLP